jgi:uncharacterized repeat protein (TIGR01451 family)
MRISRRLPSQKLLLGLTYLTVVCAVLACSAVADAEVSLPGWELSASTVPTHLAPGGEGYIDIHVYNIGSVTTSGTVTVTDTLPVGLRATTAGYANGLGGVEEGGAYWGCSVGAPEGRVVTCVKSTPIPPCGIAFAPNENPIQLGAATTDRLGIRVKA